MVLMVKSPGRTPASTSSHVTGVETVAPGSGRMEYTAAMFAYFLICYPAASLTDRIYRRLAPLGAS